MFFYLLLVYSDSRKDYKMPLTAAQDAQAVLLTDQGRTQREVSAILNLPRTT